MSKKRTLFSAALGTMLGAALCGVVPECGLPVQTAYAQSMEDIETARKLVAQAQDPFNRQANTELDHGERKKARKEAYTLLKKARNLYVAFLDANPSKEEEFDQEFSKMATMLHFIKKHAGIWDFSPRRTWDNEPKDPNADKPAANGDDKPTEKPTDTPTEQPDDKPTEKPGADAKGPSDAPAAPTPAELAQRDHQRILAYQKAHPGDVAGLSDLCLRFLADHEDATLPEYEKVALLSGELSERLNAFYREQTNQDPDAIDGGDSKDLEKMVTRLTALLRKGEDDQRMRAARLLGESRSGVASYPLVAVLKSEEGALREAARVALVQIGGSRTAENVIKNFRNMRKAEDQMLGLNVLIEISKKSEVDARGAVVPIGRFILSKKESVAGHALDYLASLGKLGGPGLVEGLETGVTLKKVEIIQKLGVSKYYKAAAHLTKFLIKTDKPRPVKLKAAAQEALRKMGICAIPHMIPGLAGSRTRLWTAEMMRQISGARVSSKPKAWRAWYEANKPAGGCGE